MDASTRLLFTAKIRTYDWLVVIILQLHGQSFYISLIRNIFSRPLSLYRIYLFGLI